MIEYKVQITNKALSDMEDIYNYIVKQLSSPEAAMRQYNKIADAIETLNIFPERIKLMETEKELAMGLRQMPVDNFFVFFHIREDRVIVTNVLYSSSDMVKRLRF